ncbi:ATP-binding protein [Maribacter sp. 2307UL18-2]|uniref:tetratricopeptide repeat-containing sensor histidine kinase n=1 Tax=Maribacter sp. 2307UL18-2 TaxID=3386274 RepID=UPI0039BC67A5
MLIKQGRDKKNSFEERSAYLEKAEALSKSMKDSLKVKYFSKLSLAYLRLKDSSKFRKANTTALALAKKMGDSTAKAEAHWDLAEFLRANSVADSAYYHFASAQKLYNALGENDYSGRMFYNMAIVQLDVRDYTGSEINTVKAIELLKPINANRQLYRCYNNLAIISREFKNYNQALTYHQEGQQYLKKSKSRDALEIGLKNNIGSTYKKQGDFMAAKILFEEVVTVDSIYFKNPRLYARSINNLAYSKLKLNEESELPELFYKAMHIQDSIGDTFELAHTNYNLGEYYLKQKDTAKALGLLNKAHDLAKQSSNYSRLLETLKLLPKANPKNARDYVQEYIALNDSLQTEDRKIRNKFARIRFETDEVVAENELLARQRQLWTGIALTLLLLGIAAFVIISQRIKNQKLKFQQEQQTSNQEILDLLLSQGEKLQEGKQIEQKRISEELHDGVQGRLQGARMMLLGLNKRDDDDAKSERSRAIVMLKDIQEEVRSISHELSHAAYQKIHNFILSLEDLKTTIEKSADITIDFNYAEHLDWDALNSDIKINLYRIIQESLQNAVKHAQCTHIDLQLTADTATVGVRITDNGKGFVVKKGKKGIGMRNIASRTTKVNGTWNIESEIGNGTTVSLTIPIIKKDTRKEAKKESENLQNA